MNLLQEDTDITEQDIGRITEKALAVTVPHITFQQAWPLIDLYFSPRIIGLDHVPQRPTLFIGNHSLFGLDALIFSISLHHRTGRFVRALGDKFFFESPLGEQLIRFGVALANPKVCSALMEAGEDILVFPGGAAESTKTADKKYTLQWRERYGFLRMAAQHGYDVTPFGLVGPDDCYRHVLEGNQLLDTWPGKLATQLGLTEGLREDLLPPIPAGLFSTPIPKPQPSYLAFGEPITVPDYKGEVPPKSVLKPLRNQTAHRIDGLIADMLALRAAEADKQSRMRKWLLRC